MRVLYDHQIFTTQESGGISRYFYGLIREFTNMQEIDPITSIIVSSNHYISDQKCVRHINLFSNKRIRGKYRLFNLLNKPYSILKLKQQKFEIFHPTYYDPYFLTYIGNKPFVLTVHDMIHEKFKEMFPSTDQTSQRKKLLVEKASKVIVVSENTKKDLIEIFGTEESKIEVIYPANSLMPELNVVFNLERPSKYILFVGLRTGYKNFERFIRSIAKILNQNKDLFVVCVGGSKFKNDEKQVFIELDIEKQILHYTFLDDKTLACIYKNALFFIFPSLYEGFGFPILESFACGCPVLCSNKSSLPEIAGDAALYFDPYIEESIANAVKRILKDESLRKDLITKGFQRLRKFSWAHTTQQTKNIYERVSDKR